MAKFYVSTGGFESILFAQDPKDAAKKVLQTMMTLDCNEYGHLTQVGERGFRHRCPTATFFATANLMKEVIG